MNSRFAKRLNGRKSPVIYALIVLLLFTGMAMGQFRRGGGGPPKQQEDLPPVYDVPKTQEDLSGKFTFARIRYESGNRGLGQPFGDHGPPWSHDYPDAGRHLMKIMSELSKTDVTLDTNEVIYSLDDPNLFKYPFAYLCEVGYMWNVTDKEVQGLREYLLRGGFLLVDDFRGRDIEPFAEVVRRAFPEYQLKQLDITNPIFNCFFSIKTLNMRPPYGRDPVVFYGLEDDTGRLMMILNYNNDVSDWWQWSNDPMQPIDDTNEAYKFGVNYIMYALTH
jgi:hypothetical protein